VGSIYALSPLVLISSNNVTEIINFAQGEFVMLGGLVMVSFQVTMGVPIWLSFPLSIIAVTLIGMLLDRLAFGPFANLRCLRLIIATIAASILIKGVAMLIWGKNPLDLPAFSGRNPITFFGAVIQPQYFWVIGFLIIVVCFLKFFFNKTIIGKP